MFLSLTRSLRKGDFNATSLKQLLLAQTGESSVWPDDAAFREAWLHKTLYGSLNSPKLVHLYARLNQTYMSSKAEPLAFSKPPTVEHIMPQSWIENWPLQSGSKGMDFMEIFDATEGDPRAAASRKRETTLQTLGNMTILSTAMNTAQSNYGWNQKRQEMKKHSLLPINQTLVEMPVWDETTILKRGEELFGRALHIWRR